MTNKEIIEKNGISCGTCCICEKPNDDDKSYVCSLCSYSAMKRKVDELQKALTLQKEEFEKMIEKVGLDDIKSFLENLKNLRIDKQSGLNYEDGELPFGTCDYMAIDDMVCKLQELLTKIKEIGE